MKIATSEHGIAFVNRGKMTMIGIVSVTRIAMTKRCVLHSKEESPDSVF